MRTGQHKDKFYAACFVLRPEPKKDELGEVVHKQGVAVPTPEELVFKPMKTEVAYWSTKSAADAKAGLKKVLEDRGYKEDTERTASDEEMKMETSVGLFKKRAKEKAEREARERAEAEAAKKAAAAKAKA